MSSPNLWDSLFPPAFPQLCGRCGQLPLGSTLVLIYEARHCTSDILELVQLVGVPPWRTSEHAREQKGRRAAHHTNLHSLRPTSILNPIFAVAKLLVVIVVKCTDLDHRYPLHAWPKRRSHVKNVTERADLACMTQESFESRENTSISMSL
jgi:hypothetical protein